MLQTPSKYVERVRAIKAVGFKIQRHKNPTKGQKDYVRRLYNKLFSSGPIISRKLNKAQLKYFAQTDFAIYKGRLALPTYGNTIPKIVRNDFGYTIERKYDNTKTVSEITLKNGARIDESIVDAFHKLGPDQYLFVGTSKNRFSTRFRTIDDFVMYSNRFDKTWNKNEKEMRELYSHISVISIHRGQASKNENSGSR